MCIDLAMLISKIFTDFFNLFFSNCSYKKLMSLKITDTDIRPKISLKFGTKGIFYFHMSAIKNCVKNFDFLCKVSCH